MKTNHLQARIDTLIAVIDPKGEMMDYYRLEPFTGFGADSFKKGWWQLTILRNCDDSPVLDAPDQEALMVHLIGVLEADVRSRIYGRATADLAYLDMRIAKAKGRLTELDAEREQVVNKLADLETKRADAWSRWKAAEKTLQELNIKP